MATERTSVLLAGLDATASARLCALLIDRHYVLANAPSGAETMRRTAEESFDAVVLGAHLPDGPPLPVAHTLRAQCRFSAILVAQDQPDTISMLEAYRAGADDVLPYASDLASLDLAAIALDRAVSYRRSLREVHRLREQMEARCMDQMADEVLKTTHDMNQPLTVILGTLSVLLLELPDDSPLREDLHIMQTEADRLRTLTLALSTLSSSFLRPTK